MTEPTPAPQPAADENSLIAERRSKLAALRGQGVAFPNDFQRAHYAQDLQAEFADKDTWTAEKLEALDRRVAVAGPAASGGRALRACRHAAALPAGRRAAGGRRPGRRG
jgi:lysyl-tRNA synthetase class II